MHLQADLECKQNQIKKLNDEFNVDMFHMRVRGAKAFAAEQKIREFKKILLRNKRLEKDKGKRIKRNDLSEKLLKISTKQSLQSISWHQKQLKKEV